MNPYGMPSYSYHQGGQPPSQPMFGGPVTVNPVDPFVVETLQGCMGQYVVIETTRGRIEGVVQGCKPDHVALRARNNTFFVRIAEIVWIMPD
ncbi:YuzF family protein [Paenibacillus methanolicus]|uniref:Uncharacterized protein DUF2642 n=1 Tax=Paenibacillus methanolicus TaxID=582686 RepID=A0A5S5C6E3_9BACL|nr:uncharacterized protein DUF2642 [Paenibacillus methanolicus]